MPFISEEIYKNLLNEESVHLSDWPKAEKSYFDESLEKQMESARIVTEAGHAKRKSDGLKVRLPLLKLQLKVETDASTISAEVWDVVLKELNIKNIQVNSVKYPKTEVKVTPEELKKEGNLRELLRMIQNQRKILKLKPTDKINLTVPTEFAESKEYLQKKVLAEKITLGNGLDVKAI